MAEASRSNRPTPRTPAAIEAELRRRIRTELAEARGQTEGELDDQTLAGIIARAIASALSWHLEAPEHTRNATVSSRTWRPAGGPRGGQSREETAERGPRDFEDRPRRPPPFRERNFEDRPPRGPYQERRPRDFEERRTRAQAERDGIPELFRLGVSHWLRHDQAASHSICRRFDVWASPQELLNAVVSVVEGFRRA